MAGLKLSAKAQEEHEFLESVLRECDHLAALTEQYVGGKGAGQDQTFQLITRTLQHLRQKAMMKNLGPLGDAAGMLAVNAARGSVIQRTRTLREGIASFKLNAERTMKASITADERQQKEQEEVRAARKRAKDQQDRAAAAYAAEQAKAAPAKPAPPPGKAGPTG